jgi:hypothetical protein
MQGIRLYNSQAGSLSAIYFEDAYVGYAPAARYRIEKQDPEDPTKMIRQGKYRIDKVSVNVAITPEEYQSLLSFLVNSTPADTDIATGLYAEFGANSIVLPIDEFSLPEMDDNLHFWPDEISFSLTSKYFTNPGLPQLAEYGAGAYGSGQYSF